MAKYVRLINEYVQQKELDVIYMWRVLITYGCIYQSVWPGGV